MIQKVYLQFYMIMDKKIILIVKMAATNTAINGFAREKMTLLLIVCTDFHQLGRWSIE